MFKYLSDANLFCMLPEPTKCAGSVDQGAISDQQDSVVDEKSENNNSLARTEMSEERSVGEVSDDSDADGDDEEYEASIDGLSGTELTQIERVKTDFPESEPILCLFVVVV